MKHSRIRLAITIVVTIVAFAIAIPTVYFNISGEDKRLRGIDPQDLSEETVANEFHLRPALDFQEGKVVNLEVDMSALPKSQRVNDFTRIRNIIFTRLSRVGLSDFELNALVDQENGVYRLVLNLPEELERGLLEYLFKRGEVSVWSEDPTPVEENSKTKDPLAGTAFEGRIQTGITNKDIQSVGIISDSRIYYIDPATPNNFGLRVTYREESAPKYVNAILSGSRGLPLLYAIDGEPIAFQTPGQYIDVTNIGRESLLVSLGPDNRIFNSIIASVMSTPTINFPVKITEINDLSTTYSTDLISTVKIGTLITFIFTQGLLVLYFKRDGWLAVIANSLVLIWAIALMKIFNVTLSLSSYAGVVLALGIFSTFIVFLLYKIRDKKPEGVTRDELLEVYDQTSAQFRILFIAAVVSAIVLLFNGILVLTDFANGFGFALVAGFLVMIIAVRAILPYLFLKD